MLSAIRLSVIILSVIMFNIVMLIAAWLNVVALSGDRHNEGSLERRRLRR